MTVTNLFRLKFQMQIYESHTRPAREYSQKKVVSVCEIV